MDPPPPAGKGEKLYTLNLVDIEPPGQGIPGKGLLFAYLQPLKVEVVLVLSGLCYPIGITHMKLPVH